MSEDDVDKEDTVDVQIIAHFCDPAILTRLDAVIQKTGRPRSSFVEEAILESIEDAEDVLVAEERIRDLEEGRSYTISLDEIDAEEEGLLEAQDELLQG